MKKCMNCDMEVGGERVTCPLCQGALIGEGSPDLWPVRKDLKKQTRIFKLQLFLVACLCAVFLLLDFVLRDPKAHEIHFSIPFLLWAVAFELVLKNATHWISSPAKIINLLGLLIGLLTIFTSGYFGFLLFCLEWIIPIGISVLLIINFIFAIHDKDNDVLIYLLCDILVGLFPYIIQFIIKGRENEPYAWTVCMIISVIAFLGIIIFKGKETWNEVQKRLHM